MIKLITNNKLRTFLWFFSCLLLPSASFAQSPLNITPYTAEYKVFRSGKHLGSAVRTLKQTDIDGKKNAAWQLSYSSHVEWMIFEDKRTETSIFVLEDNQVHPLQYKMTREGFGSDKNYLVTFDRGDKKVFFKKEKHPRPLAWNEDWLDSIAYQQQMAIDIAAGKTRLKYDFLSRKAEERIYEFEVDKTEILSLPVGQVEAIKVKRLYKNDKTQTWVWLAPEYNYALVKLWKSKKGVEQFDLQLESLTRD